MERLPFNDILLAAGIVPMQGGYRVLPADELSPQQAQFRSRAFR
jgi:hypothetical protein